MYTVYVNCFIEVDRVQLACAEFQLVIGPIYLQVRLGLKVKSN